MSNNNQGFHESKIKPAKHMAKSGLYNFLKTADNKTKAIMIKERKALGMNPIKAR